MMASRTIPCVGTLLVALTLVSVSSTEPIKGNTSPCGVDPSGAYTDLLCPDDHIYASAYLVDANERYRFYYQADGNAVIYDTSVSPWQANVIWPYGTLGTPWIMVFESSSSVAKLAAYNENDEFEYDLSVGSGGSHDNYARLDTDGCLRFYAQGGASVLWAWGCS